MTRHRNLFWLAHLCHIHPNDTWDLRIGDFAQLLAGIQQEQARKPKGGAR